MEPMSLATIAAKFSDEAAAWEYVENLRWHGRPVCAHCGSTNVLYLAPRGGTRTTRTGAPSYRKVWRCRQCRRQFSVLVGTVFEGTKIPLRKWLMAIYLMCAGKNGVSALELQRDLGITYKSAWFMVHRIREAMAHSPNAPKLFGVVIADETFVGGKPRNRHGHAYGEGGQGRTRKAPVLSVVDRSTGEVRSTVLPNIGAAAIRKALAEQVDLDRTTLHTDEAPQYSGISARHGSVNHKAREYVRNGVTTNHAEGFFSQFKRSLTGTHHSVSKGHLGRYAREFDFRATTRKMSDAERAAQVWERADGAYLSYRRLIAAGPVALGRRQRPPGRPGPRQASPAWLPRMPRGAG